MSNIVTSWPTPRVEGPPRYGLTLDESVLESSPCGRRVDDYDWAQGDRGRLAIRSARAWVELDACFWGWSGEGCAVFGLLAKAGGGYGIGLPGEGLVSALFPTVESGSRRDCRVWFGGRWLPECCCSIGPWWEGSSGGEEGLVVRCHLPRVVSVLDEVLAECL